MGHLLYGEHAAQIHLDDRLLAHLQVVIIHKVRRGESFAFSWTEPTSAGSGRNTIWLHPFVTLRFQYAGNRTPTLNQAWLTQLEAHANSGAGLRCVPEPPSAASMAKDHASD